MFVITIKFDIATFVSGKALAAGDWWVKTGGQRSAAHSFLMAIATSVSTQLWHLSQTV